jgi:protein-disulfide isomerase
MTHFTFEIASPERVVLKANMHQVSAPTVMGEITILPSHIPLVALLKPGVIEAVTIDVRFIVRQFPVEELHPGATQAAVASRCAMKQGKFWPYFDRLFQQPAGRTDEDYLRHAQDVGLDVAAFQACQADTSVAAGVDQDLADGLAAGVEGTPTFFFNGVRVQGALDAQTIDFLIAKNLRSNP